jgi:hypothetical protein
MVSGRAGWDKSTYQADMGLYSSCTRQPLKRLQNPYKGESGRRLYRQYKGQPRRRLYSLYKGQPGRRLYN